MSFQSRRISSLLAFVAILLIATWLRVHEAATIPPAMHFDEATELLRAWRISRGVGLPLYFNEAPEPFDAFYRGVFGYFVGLDRVTQRYTMVYLSVLSVAAVMGAARALYKRHPQRFVIMIVAGLALAVMPPSVMIGRTIYRANWIAPMTLLAIMWLARAWNTHKTRDYLLAAAFTALGAMFYPAGVFFPPTMGLLFVLAALVDRRTFPGWRRSAMMALVFLVVMIPWIYLFIRIPDWLTQRLDDLSGQGLPIIGNPAAFLDQLWLSVRLIFAPPTMREPIANGLALNTTTTAFLNPVLFGLFVLGVGRALWRWRDPRAFAPLVIIVGMVMPGALTITPEEAIRFIGMYGALALLAGVGAGVLAQFLAQINATTFNKASFNSINSNKTRHNSTKFNKLHANLTIIAITLLTLISTAYTWTQVRDHYVNWRGDDRQFFTRLQAQAAYIRNSDVPIYLPLEYMNYRITSAYLRPEAFPNLRAYNGEALPAGEMLLPFDAAYGTPIISRPTTAYVLLLPETGETVVLPPLPQTDLQALEARAQSEGTLLNDELGRELGHILAINADDNPFSAVLYQDFTNAEPIAVFDDNLEVMDIRAPQTLTGGEFVPVTVYWRLRHQPAADYFMMLQIWSAQQESFGRHEDWLNDIFFDFAPTPMWTAGQVFAQTRWVQVYPEIPEGGYRFALRVFTYPAAVSSTFTAVNGFPGRGDWLLTARSFVGAPPTPELSGEIVTVDAQLGDSLLLTSASFEPPLETLQANDTVTVTLQWQTLAAPPEDYIMFLHLFGANDTLVAQQDARPSEVYPTDTWNTAMTFTTTHTLTLAPDAVGDFVLKLGMYSFPARDRLTITQAGVMLENGLVILNPE